MNALISIIVPVYNVESYLERCIDSIINQRHKNLEIILINDGSTDSSGKICDDYAKNDDRIKVYHIKNGGSSIARNYGIERSSGEYIGFVDSDDWIKPEMYHELIKFALKHKLKVVECSHIKASDVKLKNNLENNEIRGKIESRDIALKRIINNKRFAVWRRLYHKSVIENRYFIKNILHQDVYYTVDILNEVNQIGFIENKYYVYNLENPNSVIRSNYSIKKLNSIHAGNYVVNNTKQYNREIRSAAKQYLFEFLTSHYNSLYKNPDLDVNFAHRNKIKATIKKYHSLKDFDFYSFVIIYVPSKLYNLFLVLNKTRVITKLKIIQFFKNV